MAPAAAMGYSAIAGWGGIDAGIDAAPFPSTGKTGWGGRADGAGYQLGRIRPRKVDGLTPPVNPPAPSPGMGYCYVNPPAIDARARLTPRPPGRVDGLTPGVNPPALAGWGGRILCRAAARP